MFFTIEGVDLPSLDQLYTKIELFDVAVNKTVFSAFFTGWIINFRQILSCGFSKNDR